MSTVGFDTATKIAYTSYYDTFTVGAGYIDIMAALNCWNAAAGSAVSPFVKFNLKTGALSVNTVPGVNAIWGSNIVWGSSTLSPTLIADGEN